VEAANRGGRVNVTGLAPGPRRTRVARGFDQLEHEAGRIRDGDRVFAESRLDILDRRAWEEALLAGYLKDLKRFGAPAPSFAEAWLAYRASTICPLMIWLNNSSAWQPEATNTANAARAAAAVLDHDAFGLLGV